MSEGCFPEAYRDCGLLAEIKRLQSYIEQQNKDCERIKLRSGALNRQLAAKDAQIAKLEAEIDIDNKLLADRDRIYEVCQCPEHGKCIPYVIEQLKSIAVKDARIREIEQIAIQERAKVLYFAHAGDDMYDMEVLEESDRLKSRHMRQAAKDLAVEARQQASYLERMESAFIHSEACRLAATERYTEPSDWEQEAQAARQSTKTTEGILRYTIVENGMMIEMISDICRMETVITEKDGWQLLTAIEKWLGVKQ